MSAYIPVSQRRPLGERERALLLDLAENGVAIAEIGRELRRDARDVLVQFNAVMAEMDAKERAAFKARRKAALEKRTGWIASQKATLDAKRRARARDTSLGAMLFGDPPPGFSALDRRPPQLNVARHAARAPSPAAQS